MPAVVPPRQAPLSGRGGEGASLSGDELDRQTGLRGSPTRRHSSGKLGGLGAAFMDKLHFRPLTSASGGGGGGASGLIGRHSGPHSGKSSGKHTPTSREATGDFGEFLAAAELRAALEEEQKRAQKKAGVSPNKKQKRNSFGAGLGLTARTGHKGQGDRTSPRSEQSHSEVELGGAGPSAPPERTLADRKHFPGDLHHHGHIANPRISNGGMHHRSSSHTPALPRQSSARSRSERQRLERPLGPCGTAEFTSDSLTEESSDDEPSLLRDGLADEPDTGGRSVAGPSSRPLSRRASASSSASDDSLVTKAREVAREASTRSLKSWKSDGESMRSLASGGANPALSKPLLELEELELESFLKNFGRVSCSSSSR